MKTFTTLLSSRKTWLSISSTLVGLIALLSTWGSLVTPDQKLEAIKAFLYSTAAVWGLNVAGVAHEDAAAKSGPQNQTNVASEVTNQTKVNP